MLGIHRIEEFVCGKVIRGGALVWPAGTRVTMYGGVPPLMLSWTGAQVMTPAGVLMEGPLGV